LCKLFFRKSNFFCRVVIVPTTLPIRITRLSQLYILGKIHDPEV
jgi:hypothetical protein